MIRSVFVLLMALQMLASQINLASPVANVRAGQDTTRVNVLNALSRKFAGTGEYSSSLLYADSALTFAISCDYSKGKGDAYNNLGSCYYRQGNMAEAIKKFMLALDIWEKTGDKKGMASIYNNLGTILTSQGNYPEAMTNFKKSISIREAIGDRQGVISAYSNIGSIERLLGNYSRAMEYYQAGLKIAEETGNKSKLATFHLNIGNIHNKEGNDSEAVKCYRTALKISEETGDKETVALCYHNIGRMHTLWGNYHEALDFYYRALKIREEIGALPGIAHTLDNIAAVLALQKRYDEALEMFSSVLQIYEELGSRQRIAHSYHEIGFIHSVLGQYQDALDNHFTSLKISEEIGDKESIALANSSIGAVYMKTGYHREALHYYLESVRISEEIGDHEAIAHSNNQLGEINIYLGKYKEARKNLTDALAFGRRSGYKSIIRDGYNSLSHLDSAEGNHLLALANYKLSVIYKDSLLNEESNRQTAYLKIQFETDKKDREIEVLHKDMEISSLQLKQRQVSLLASRLEAATRRDQLTLVQSSYEIQQLKLSRVQEDLKFQQAEVRAKTSTVELLNKDSVLKEQQLATQKLIRNLMFGGTGLLVMVVFLIIRSLQLRKRLERQKAVACERQRISADLHDEIGSGLSRISLLTELMKKEAATPEVKRQAETIAAVSGELSGNISEIIWALNSNNDHLESMVAYIRRYAAAYFEDSLVELKITIPGEIAETPVSGEYRRNIFFAVKEALYNIMKHARATEAELKFLIGDGMLTVIIRDNGQGLPHGEMNRFGNGLKNMQLRMKNMNGEFFIENHIGTTIKFVIPVG